MRAKQDMAWIHRQAGLAATFEAQDEGVMGSLDYTSILGQVPSKNIWIVLCQLTVTDEVADGEYWWTMEMYLAVYKKEGKPISRYATDEELEIIGEETEKP